MKEHRSGLMVPDSAAPCEHPSEKVDRLRSGYRCKQCGSKVWLVTVETRFMNLVQLKEHAKDRKEKSWAGGSPSLGA